MPFDLIFQMSVDDSSAHANQLIRIARIGKLYKLVKIIRMVRLMKVA